MVREQLISLPQFQWVQLLGRPSISELPSDNTRIIWVIKHNNLHSRRHARKQVHKLQGFYIQVKPCMRGLRKFLQIQLHICTILSQKKKMKYIHYCHGSRFPVKESIGNIVSRKLHPNSFSRMVFENYSMMFCKTKARLKIWNVFNLFFMFLNAF